MIRSGVEENATNDLIVISRMHAESVFQPEEGEPNPYSEKR